MIEIRVDGEPLDLFPGEKDRFFVSLNVHDLRTLSTRNGSTARQMDIPTTAHNKRLLGVQLPSKLRFGDLQRTIGCQVLADGIPIFTDSYFIVTEEKKDLVSLQIFGGTAKFYSQLRDVSIRQLDFGELDIDWTLSEVDNIANNTTGICYANSLWYDNPSQRTALEKGMDQILTENEHLELRESGFFIYAKTILEKIFDSISGLSLDTSNMDDLFDRFAIACPVYGFHDAFKQDTGDAVEVRQTNQIPINSGVQPFPEEVSDPGNLWNTATNTLTFAVAGTYNITFNARAQLSYTDILLFQCYHNSDVVAQDSITGTPDFPLTFDLDFSTTIEVEAGDTLYIQTTIEIRSGHVITILNNASLIVDQVGTDTGDRLIVSQNLPDISQREFVRNLFNQFNIIPTESEDTVYLNYFQSLNATDSEELLIDVNQPVSVISISSNYGQVSTLKYKDDDKVERLNTKTTFEVNSLTAVPDKVLIEQIFSASDKSAIQETAGDTNRIVVPAYSLEYNEVTDNSATTTSGSAVVTTASGNSILRGDLVYINGTRARVISITSDTSFTVDVNFGANYTGSWEFWRYTKQDAGIHVANLQDSSALSSIWDGGTDESPVGSHKVAEYTNLDWDYLKDTYYYLLVDSIKNPFVIQAYTHIPVNRLLNLDGLTIAYIEDYNSYFYLNKVEQWKLDGFCRLELIELAV